MQATERNCEKLKAMYEISILLRLSTFSLKRGDSTMPCLCDMGSDSVLSVV